MKDDKSTLHTSPQGAAYSTAPETHHGGDGNPRKSPSPPLLIAAQDLIMDELKDLNIRVDDQFLMEMLKLTPNFIAKNARAMGNFTKPRGYFISDVLEYLEYLRDLSKEKSGIAKETRKKIEGEKAVRLLDSLIKKHRAIDLEKKRKRRIA